MPRIAKINRPTEYLPCISEIKEVNDAKYQIGGYINFIGNLDFGKDRTMRGAFRKTLSDSYARKSAQELDFLWPYLWNHNYSILPPGGIYDGDEDKKGLYTRVQFNPEIQFARELFSSFKMKTMSKQSMGYKAHQVEWVKDEKTGEQIRNLLEVEVMEGSAVVFPMNDLAQVDTVKHLFRNPSSLRTNDLAQVDTVKRFWPGFSEKGSASGKTTWPLADRGASWDGGQARKDIQAWASSGDTVNWSKAAQCFFWVEKSPPENMSQCKMPFVAKSGGAMKAIPAGIIAAAGSVSGARTPANIDDVDGVKSKIASYYSKMKMTPPWEKGATMDIWNKDYATSYRETTQMDWVSDLWNLWYPLRNEIITAFQTGDTPEADVQAALKQFSAATIAYIQRGVELNMTECLQPDDDDTTNPMPSMMSADDNPETKEEKAGRVISAANHAKLASAAKGITEHNKGIDEHIMTIKKVLSSASAAGAQNRLSGYQVYSLPEDESLEQKQEDDAGEPEQKKEEAVEDIHSLLHDLTLLLQADNSNRGV